MLCDYCACKATFFVQTPVSQLHFCREHHRDFCQDVLDAYHELCHRERDEDVEGGPDEGP